MWKKRNEPDEKVQAETRPLKLSRGEREAITHGTRVRSKIRDRIKAETGRTKVIEFTVKELEHMLDEFNTAAEFVPETYKKRLVAVVQRISDLLDERSPVRRRPAQTTGTVLQFKVTLLGAKPPIWRRVQTKDGTLGDLHDVIQTAMGWENCHLHRFVIHGAQYGSPSPDDLDFGFKMKNEKKFCLSQLFPTTSQAFRFKYEYDFGDGWLHEVLFEGHRPIEKETTYPLCLEGARACPPEDVGGVGGYDKFLEALADPEHERHEEFMDWAGPFDPEKFDPKEVTKRMRKGLPD
jgi:Plasmid pRiA4b ORF-3-like protein